MGGTGNSTTQPLPANSAIPQPSGYDESGVPFWMINGKRLLWAELQQVLWQQSQATQQPQANGRGPEAMPTMPIMPSIDFSQESKAEKGAEKAEDNAEKANDVIIFQPQSTAVSTATTGGSKTKKKQDVFSHTPALKTVDLSDKSTMVKFVEENKGKSKNSSNFALSMLLRKLLQVVSAA